MYWSIIRKQWIRQKERGEIEVNLPRALDSPVTESGSRMLHSVKRTALCYVEEGQTGRGMAAAQPEDSTGDNICVCQLLSVCVGWPRITMIFTLQQLPSWEFRMLHKWRWGLPALCQEGPYFTGHWECITVLSASFMVGKKNRELVSK